MEGEPASPEAVAAWIRLQTEARDPFAPVRAASESHRLEHGPGCTVYPTSSGPLLGVLAGATAARRILEVGCGLGYSALWLAHGSGPKGRVETVEQDPLHVALARGHLQERSEGDRIAVLEGSGREVLPALGGPYDLVFCDGDLEEYLFDLEQFPRLLRPRGLLVTANLFLGQHAPDIPGLEQAAAYRLRLLEDPLWRTAFLPSGLALSVRR